MLSVDQITYRALKKEHARLSKAEDKAKAEYDEYMNIHHELIAIRQELAEIVKSKEHGPHILKKLNKLQERSNKAEKIRKKDLLKLIDKHQKLQIELDHISWEIGRFEFRAELKGRTLKQGAL